MSIGAILLAAGASKRFGAENKLVAELGGKPLIRRAAEQILCGGVEVTVVTGCDRALIENALQGLPLRFAHNFEWAKGMGSSVAVGVTALDSQTQGAFIAPGDLPFLPSSLLKELIASFNANQKRLVVYPTTPVGEQRNPVLWPRRFFPLLALLSGSQGAKQLLAECGDAQKQGIVVDEGAVIDVDLPTDLEAARSRLKL